MICVYAMFKVLSVTQWQIPLTVILSEDSLCSVTLGGVDRGRHRSCAHSEVSPFPPHTILVLPT